LEPGAPVLAHLSGGLDSSLIVCVAERIRRAKPFEIETVTERFPGASWDEGAHVQEVLDWTGVSNDQWDGGVPNFVDLSSPVLAGPGMGVARASGTTGDLDIARRKGVRVLLSGEGGDQLGLPSGRDDDEVSRRPFEYVTQLIRSRGVRASVWPLARQLVRPHVPMQLRRIRALRRYRRELPTWLQSGCHDAAEAIVDATLPVAEDVPFEYQVQRAHWRDLTSGRMAAALSLLQQVANRYGAEYRFPFLDQELVELVLSVRSEHWPRMAPGARLHRDAMRDFLPPGVGNRHSKAIFSGAVGQYIKSAAALVRTLFHEGEWLSAKYVRRNDAQAILAQALATPVTQWLTHWRLWLNVRAIATLEAWLRSLLGYSVPRGESGYEPKTF